MDQPVAGLLTGPEAARAARRDAGGLGRRVRPHADDARRATAATTTPPASPCGWPAAACKGGQAIGATDDLGLHAVEDRLHVHDLHATILYLLGLDNMGLVYKYKGRPERPTLNEGEPYKKITG